MEALPSVILVHGHDIGRWLSVYDHPSVPTPQLAAFADRGLTFDRAFATAPLCSPARGSLYTGLMPHEHGIMGMVHHAWRYRSEVVTLPEYLKTAGYDTALAGLQHENVDSSVIGFDEVLSDGFLPRAIPVSDLAVEWLMRRDERSDNVPFLLSVGFWEAHRPWSSEDYAAVDPSSVEVPRSLPDTPGTRSDLASFYGALAQLDEAFGRLMTAIDSTKLGRESIVIFTTDHGAAFPRAKSTLYDAGVGVSLLIKPPESWGVAPARRSEIVSHLDLVPTIIEVAGLPQPEELSGISLLPLLRGGAHSSGSRTLFFEKSYHDGYDPQRAVRNADYKYIRSFDPPAEPAVPLDIRASETYRSSDDWSTLAHTPEELFDLKTDPDELTNVSRDAAHEAIRTALAMELEEWMVRTNDPLLDGPIAAPPRRSRTIDALPKLSVSPHDKGVGHV